MAARRENAREGKGGSHFFAGNMQGITKLAIRQRLDGFLESGDEATLSLARNRLEQIKSNPTSSAAYGEMLELWRMTMDN